MNAAKIPNTDISSTQLAMILTAVEFLVGAGPYLFAPSLPEINRRTRNIKEPTIGISSKKQNQPVKLISLNRLMARLKQMIKIGRYNKAKAINESIGVFMIKIIEGVELNTLKAIKNPKI